MDNAVLGGFSSSLATVFTNPLEVVKTRLQLQGELAKKGTVAEPYKNFLQGFVQIAKHDGYLALQKGLSASLCFQFVLNSCRLGIYTTAYEKGWTRSKDGTVSVWKSALIGGVGGTFGQALASPFSMLRSQLMSASVEKIAVGYQHKHDGFIEALIKIYKTHGMAGLYRGVLVTVPRGMMGSGTQIATFGCMKDFLQRNHSDLDSTSISIVSGVVAGTAMAVAMSPPDLIATRVYNQGVSASGKGVYYSGVIDCVLKTAKAEGLRGFYKGFWPNYIRIGPHSALVLVFFDELKVLKEKLYPS